MLLGGGAYAATQLPKDSVGTKQLRRNSVTAAKLRRGAVNTAKLKKNAVTTAKLRNGSVTADKLGIDSVTSASVTNHSLRASDFKAGQLPEGPQGEPGPLLEALPSGKTLRGTYDLSSTDLAVTQAVTFQFPLAEPVDAHFPASEDPTACPETPEDPQDLPGPLSRESGSFVRHRGCHRAVAAPACRDPRGHCGDSGEAGADQRPVGPSGLRRSPAA